MIDPLRWPTAALSRITGRLARVPIPRPLRRPVLAPVARVLGMELGEAAHRIDDYRSVDALFVRSLRPGARTWPEDPAVPASPVDGVVGQSGVIRDGRVLQAKGREYSAAELVDDAGLAARMEGGTFLTLYLAPRHYHRIHAPVAGRLAWARHVPGRLLPVNAPAVRTLDRLFPRNERLVCVIEPAPAGDVPGREEATAGGRGAVAVVAVGAFNVGRISAAFDDDLVTNRGGSRPETRLYDPPVHLERGADLMAFHLGSTVVLLFEEALRWADAVAAGREIRLGQPLVDPDLH